uniref:neuromedin-S n=1 Tax=Semicossyphus pulcher TaxID=241346 RepID=UPI0037E92564
MTLPSVRQLFLLCLIWFLASWSTADASPFDRWEDGIAFRKVRGSGDYSDVLWGNQNEEQVQNVFKRFLFHYSKARNSVGPVQQVESHSVHPLMRLSPKLSKRKNKKFLLLIRGLPEGML